ncbi:MAG: tRNA-specific adenosine deaminase [Marinilabiliales bacterium]|nr:MAG: tRNA-specific adenosine deaminase [Marinilabiliales bacterium]
MSEADDKKFLQRAVDIASENVRSGNGGPFGAVIVKDGKIIAEAGNSVTTDLDPTAHAEVNAIRKATAELQSFQLDDCTIYSSCEPCPMCLGAIYWARPARLVFAASKSDAAAIGFDDDFIYREIDADLSNRSIPTLHIREDEFLEPFRLWENSSDKIDY